MNGFSGGVAIPVQPVTWDYKSTTLTFAVAGIKQLQGNPERVALTFSITGGGPFQINHDPTEANLGHGIQIPTGAILPFVMTYADFGFYPGLPLYIRTAAGTSTLCIIECFKRVGRG